MNGNHNSCENNQPIITVITVVYNAVNEIEKTIKSVINQSYKKIEYIIIDGGSNDGTVETIRKYEDKINFWISEPDNGIYHAMNKGIEKATGEWINFMNAGDRYTTSEVLSKIFFTDTLYDDYNVIYGNSILEKENGKLILQIANRQISEIWKGPIFRHGSMFTRTFLHKKRPFKLDEKHRVCADFDFIYYLYSQFHNMKYINLEILIFKEEGVSNNLLKNTKYNRMILLSYPHTFKENMLNLSYYFKIYVYIIFKKITNKINDLKKYL